MPGDIKPREHAGRWLFSYRIGLGDRPWLEFISGSCRSVLGHQPEDLAGFLESFRPEQRAGLDEICQHPSRTDVELILDMQASDGQFQATRHSLRPDLRAGQVVGLDGVAYLAAPYPLPSFEFIVEAINEGILMCALDGEVLYVNERMAQMLGYRREEMIGRMLFEFMSPKWAERARQNLERRRRGVAEVFEHEFLHRRGHTLQTLAATRPIRVNRDDYEASLVAITDISERALAIEQLEQSVETFRTLSENTPEGIVIHREAAIVYANPATADLLGYDSADDLLGAEFESLVPAEQWPAVQRRIQQVSGGHSLVPYTEHHLESRDGELVDVEIAHFRGIFHGEPSVISLLRDLAERKNLLARTMQFDRLIVAGTLAAGVGHEVNNPLAFLKGHIDYAEEMLADSLALLREADFEDTKPAEIAANRAEVVQSLEDISHSLRSANRGASRIRDIIQDLRLFARDEKEEAYPVDVEESLETAIQMAAHQLPDGAELVRAYDQVDDVVGYESGLGQVLLNVLINAAQAIEAAGSGQHRLQVGLSQNADKVCIEIEDTGVGIAERHRQRIFDPFYTTKEPGTGTGLGLSISKKLVERMGGEIEIESEPAEGTRVAIWLKAAS